MSVRFRATFYSKEYTRYLRFSELPDDAYVKAKIHRPVHCELSEDDIIAALPLFNRAFCNSMDGYILKKDVPATEEQAKKLKVWLDVERGRFMTFTQPEGYLYSGVNTSRKTKIKPEDLPPYYIEIKNYKRPGYLKVKGVKDILYRESPFHNHAFKDDFLYISYSDKIVRDGLEYKNADEYIFGNDIIEVLRGIERYSHIDANVIEDIKQRMVRQYNAYCDEAGHWSGSTKKTSFDEL